MKNSKIGWTNHTWNPWWGCDKVSDACKYCYIGQVMRRSGHEPFQGPMCTGKATWRKPYSWNREAAETDQRPRIFTCSMSDFFHQKADRWRSDAWEVIRANGCLDWLILTKRPELIRDRLPADWAEGYPNVWLGVTVENQQMISRIDALSKVPAAIRFVSAEPLLGPIQFGRRMRRLDWVITGCESAAKDKRRPMDSDWVRAIRDECDQQGVPLFHKQYYIGNQLFYDGFIDNEVRQAWPASRVEEAGARVALR